MMEVEEVVRRLLSEPVGTMLLCNRGACWQKVSPNVWRLSETGVVHHDEISGELLADRLISSKAMAERVGVLITWTLY